jgi:hypothetical protein
MNATASPALSTTVPAAHHPHVVARLVEAITAATVAVLVTLTFVGSSTPGGGAPAPPTPATPTHQTFSPPSAQQVLAQQNAAHRP